MTNDLKDLSTDQILYRIACLQAELDSRKAARCPVTLERLEWMTLAQIKAMQCHHPENAKYESRLYPYEEGYCAYTLKESVLCEVGEDGELLPLSYGGGHHDQAILEGKFRLIVET